MKKFYMTIVALLCGVAAMAQDKEVYLYASDVSVPAGEETETEIILNLKNTENVRAIQFKFDEFPEGMEASIDEYSLVMVEARLDLDAARLAQKKPKWNYAQLFEFKCLPDGTVIYGSKTSGYTDESGWHSVCFLGNDGPVLSIPLTVSESVAANVYKVPCTFSCSSATPDADTVPQSIGTKEGGEVVINVGGTGIHSINAADSNAPIYNVAGQRVSKAQKGIFIQNGKKVAVK
jgi:hypothetical protein